jgi:hypothetical protein
LNGVPVHNKADTYRGQPEMISIFFDQSLIALRQHTNDEIPTPEPV